MFKFTKKHKTYGVTTYIGISTYLKGHVVLCVQSNTKRDMEQKVTELDRVVSSILGRDASTVTSVSTPSDVKNVIDIDNTFKDSMGIVESYGNTIFTYVVKVSLAEEVREEWLADKATEIASEAHKVLSK